MTTILQTPIIQRSVNKATLDGWSFTVGRRQDGTLAIDAERTILTAQLTMRDQDDAVVEVRSLQRNVQQLPQEVRTAIRDLHEVIITALRASGQLPTGTDDPDF